MISFAFCENVLSHLSQETSGTLSFTVGAVANGAMSIGSGEILYIENRAPVARAADQTEDIKLIIEF